MSKPKIMMTRGVLIYSFFLFTYILCFSQEYEKNIELSFDQKIDSIINDGIRKMAFPGAQILIYKRDSILISKSYGHHTYDSLIPVKSNDLYDLASVTKILASTLALMKLYELYNIDLEAPFSNLFPLLKRSNKKNHSLKQILSHSAGWIPYLTHQNLVYKKNGGFRKKTLSHLKSSHFPDQVIDCLFVHKDYQNKIFKRIKKTNITKQGEMVYSGLIYFFIPTLVKKISGLSFRRFLSYHFFEPMGLNRITFLPTQKFSKIEIVPTEKDSIFRKQLVHGWVHDEAASLMGGISGNAGLFANTKSIFPLAKMLMQDGLYDEKRYLNSETISLFTKRTYPNGTNPRGLGFNKPSVEYDKERYPSAMVSPESFGHSGYTGTMVWVDPTNKFFLILLTNRVYPYRTQRGIYDLNIRSSILDYAVQN